MRLRIGWTVKERRRTRRRISSTTLVRVQKITLASLTDESADVCECARVDPADSRDLWPRRMINRPEPPPPLPPTTRVLHAHTHTRFRRYRFGGTGCGSVYRTRLYYYTYGRSYPVRGW
ncbi:hypothetical protein QTP88_012937 [Uroleucon formosanum]